MNLMIWKAGLSVLVVVLVGIAQAAEKEATAKTKPGKAAKADSAKAEEATTPVPLVIVKTTKGKEFTFVGRIGGYEKLVENSDRIRISESHSGNVHVSDGGLLYHAETGSVGSFLFNIEVDMGDFKKIIEPKDVKAIQFDEVKKGAFDITITLRDKSQLKIAMQGPWQDLNDEACLEGIEKTQGRIKVPLSNIRSLELLGSDDVRESLVVGPATKAKLIEAPAK